MELAKSVISNPRPIDSVGPHHMWGFSPAMDLADMTAFGLEDSELREDEEPLNILLVQPGDIRSVIKTIAQRRRHGHMRPLHFYIWDQPIEVLARHLLLLEVVHEWEIPIRQRTCLFLELFGNSLIQERTSRHLGALGKGLARLVGDGRGRLRDLVSFEHLKYRERDGLEAAFKAYAPALDYPLAQLRDTRIRHLYQKRYDSRRHLCDWDYFNGIKPYAGMIHHKQYREWRLSGVAFEFGDCTYTQPNRSMQSYTEGTMRGGRDRGLKKEVRGYWLDLLVGPYVGLGTDCDKPNEAAELLFKVMNKGTGSEQWRHNTGEIAVYNIVSYLWEIETGTRYLMRKDHDVYSGIGEDEEETRLLGAGRDAADDAAGGAPALAGALAPGAAVSVECAKFIVPLGKQEKQAFAEKICSMADSLKWRLNHESLPKTEDGEPAYEEYGMLHFTSP